MRRELVPLQRLEPRIHSPNRDLVAEAPVAEEARVVEEDRVVEEEEGRQHLFEA